MTYQHHHIAPTSMISGRNVIVSGGTFTQNLTLDRREALFSLLKDNVAHSAFHNSGARFDPPKCHPNTRVAILKKIMDWVHRSDWETWYRYILWLTGAAGSGKSAIAQSIIELCLEEGLVIASFFFFRSDGTRNNGKSFVATLVYQIFCSIPATRTQILQAISNDPLIFTKTMDHQFDTLIMQPLRCFYEPLNTLEQQYRRLIVVDGLDECLNHDTQIQILNTFRDAIRTYELPVIFLVASRPEHDIKTAFNSQHMDGIFSRLYLDDSSHRNQDIRTFLEYSFHEIKKNHPFKEMISPQWPTPGAIACIVQRSSGQFIYAATVVKYVQSIRHNPALRLDIVLRLRPALSDKPFAELDALYSMILPSAQNVEDVLYALSVYSLGVVGNSSFDISKFMSLNHGELDIMFCDLGSLVSVESIKVNGQNDKTKTLRFLHASLHDFLLDPIRSQEYFVDTDIHRTKHLANMLNFWTFCDTASREQVNFDYFRKNYPLCRSSSELMDRASLFPLINLFDPSSWSYIHYFIFYVFFPFLKHMAQKDESWILIEKQKRGELDDLFLSQMPRYYSNPHLAAMLCLVCHSGTGKSIPGFKHADYIGDEDTTSICPITSPYFQIYVEFEDSLIIRCINLENINTDCDAYRMHLITFLQDPARSGRYCLGGKVYAKTVLLFLKQIESQKWKEKMESTIEECLSDKVSFKNNIWRLTQGQFDTSSTGCFFLLGSLIFFLRHSAAYEALIQHCQRTTLTDGPAAACFPRCTALVHKAIQEYLERVGEERLQSAGK